MATSKSQQPQVNLKERIAALQQRNASPPALPLSPSVPITPTLNSAGLRDRIAKFEKKGGVPIPRGSFGLGAPPSAENAPARRRGELYGNRIPSATKPPTGSAYGSRSNSPFGFDSPRLVSTPMSEGEELDSLPKDLVNDPSSSSSPPSSPASPTSISPQTTGNSLLSLPLNRGTRFSVAMQHARRVEGSIEASMKPTGALASSPPETQPAPVIDSVQQANDQDTPPIEKVESVEPPPPLQVDVITAESSTLHTPSITLSPSGEVDQEEQVSLDHVTAVQEPAQVEKASTEASLLTAEVPSVNSSINTPTIRIDSPTPSVGGDDAGLSTSQVKEDLKEATGTDNSIVTVPSIPCDMPAEPQTQGTIVQKEIDMSNLDSNLSPVDSTLSPVGPFSLANAVHDLGQVVANIHDMFPGQISPLKSPPSYRSFHIEEALPGSQKASKVASDEPKTPEKSNKSTTDPQTNPDDTPSAQSLRLATPRTSRTARPVSMIETSPGQVVVAQRVTPATSRGVPILVPGNQYLGQPNFEHFPPTPEPNETEFGSVTLHRASYPFSQSNPYANQSASATPPTFTTVVHRKVPETSAAESTSSYQSFYSAAPATPKNQTKTIEEPLMSPGFGELATLLHEAALLEFTLEQGQLPAEKAPEGESEENQEAEKIEKEKLEKETAARAKVEEEKRKHEAVAKARAKQETRESKSRSSFRNPLLRSKNSHQRDASTDSTSSNNPARSMSVLLPFRPLPTPPPRQSSPAPLAPITPIPETEVAQDSHETDPSLLQTSPKSPRQLFAGLKRLASSSRSSTPTGTISRNSVSASSEMSSEDSMSIPTPPADSASSEAGQGGIFGSSVLTWPSLSPKKSPTLSRAASLADKMLGRGRTKSSVSANTVYETIDRITRPAAAQLPPLDPISFSLDVSAPKDEDMTSPPELVSPRRSASLYVSSTSQFPPVYSARPTSSVFTPLPSDSKAPYTDGGGPASGLDTIFSPNLKSPDFNQNPAGQGTQNINALFSVKPTSPVYTPAMTSQETITERLQQQQRLPSPQPEARLPSPQDMTNRRSSWISDMSMDSSTASIPSPFFDAFPAVPDETPLPPALPGRQRPMTRPSLPLPTPSFFEPAPLSSTPVGAEFSVSTPFTRSSTVRSATLPRLSGEHYRQ